MTRHYFLVVLVVLFAFGSIHAHITSKEKNGIVEDQLGSSSRDLLLDGSPDLVKSVGIVEACGSFEEQVLTIVKATLYSKRLNYTLVLPSFHDPDCKGNFPECSLPFASIFDQSFFLDQVQEQGYSVASENPFSDLTSPLQGESKTLTCNFPFPYDLLDAQKEALALLITFRPSLQLADKVRGAPKNMVYVRLEIKQLKDAQKSIMTDPGVSVELKSLQVASYDLTNTEVDMTINLGSLMLMSAELGSDWMTWNPLQATALHYFFALKSRYFFGSSHSKFSSLVLVHRRALDLWATIFDEGVLTPLEVQLLDPMVWVFTYNSWSSKYDYMLEAMVLSAASFGFRTFCIYGGNHSAIQDWMVEQNVTILLQEPAWGPQLWAAVLPFREENMKHSHLYASQEMVVGTWQRIDLPIIPELQQYTYVLFTDCDVFFSHKVTLLDFKDIMPVSALMGPEMQDYFPWNAGIMLMNIPYLRASYNDFLTYILTNKKGMYFDGFGPGDQGAYNSYYEKTLRPLCLPKAYNSKPYQPVLAGSKLVHFHGPKPHNFLKFFEKGECQFGGMCRQGFEGALCMYVSQYYATAFSVEVPRHLHMACQALLHAKQHFAQKLVEKIA
jgi:hypothetical protein